MSGIYPVDGQKVLEAFQKLEKAYPAEKDFRNFVNHFLDLTAMPEVVKNELKNQSLEDVKDFVCGQLAYFASHGSEVDIDVLLNKIKQLDK